MRRPESVDVRVTEVGESQGISGLRGHQEVNDALPYSALLSVADMLDLLKDENAHARFESYKRTVRAEHEDRFDHQDPLGPPNPPKQHSRP